MYDVDETIVGIASAPGGALRGVVRLSGPQVVACLARCFVQPADGDSPVEISQVPQAQVIPGDLQLGEPLPALPGELYLWPNSQSYTRQPSAEFHTIGSPPLLEAAVSAFCQAGARLAAPGEFTMRAFLAGRLDLPQAEAVLGVIDAQSRDELDVALGQLAGGLSTPLNHLRNELLELLAHLEAGLDFVEEDIEFISNDHLVDALRSAADEVSQLSQQLAGRSQTDSEIRVTLMGWPNVGKSSLFNALSGGQPAIVSDVAGTTRDYLAARLVVDDLEMVLIDTAGVEDASVEETSVEETSVEETSVEETSVEETSVEETSANSLLAGITAASQQMTDAQSQQADLQLFCLDATRPVNDWERQRLAQIDPATTLLVMTKCDGPRATDLDRPALETSSQSGQGLLELKTAVRTQLASSTLGHSVVPSTAARCRASLQAAAAALEAARATALAQAGEELVAVEIRHALDELGTVVGTVYTDDILDKIFSRFCIGK